MTGRVAVRNGIWYAVISYKDDRDQFKQRWISTGLKERGNKKEAQKFLSEQLAKFESENVEEERVKAPVREKKVEVAEKPKNDIIFMDYMKNYIENKKDELQPEVYQSYMNNYKIMKKYFGNKLKLKDVTYHHIEGFYDYLKNVRGNKNVTIKHHAIILSPALRIAYRDDLIPKNPYDFLPKIKKEKHIRDYYNSDELEELFKHTDNTKIGLVVRVAAYYGFRRSEVLGLKWKAIDFTQKTISIQHKVIGVGGEIYAVDKLKTESSRRTLPLLPVIEELLLKRQKEIEHNKFLYGKSYDHRYDEYVFVDDTGTLINPDHVSHLFSKILKKNNLKYIPFHSLRHSCASLLAANEVPIKYIQEWLGHANYNTTADVYTHLDFSTKEHSAQVINEKLTKSKAPEPESDEQLLKEIEELKKMIEEKEKQISRKTTELE